MLYIELNAVRANLVERPEDYRFSSLHTREVGNSDWLNPLTETLPAADEKAALTEYRSLIYHRGAVPTKPSHKAISQELLAKEIARGFKIGGTFLRRWAHFSDGVVISSKRRVREFIADRRQKTHYGCRREPVPKLGGLHWVLRDQFRERSPT